MKYIINYFFICFVTLGFQCTYASEYIDSLKTALKEATTDTQKINILLRLTKKTKSENLDSCYDYATQAYDLAVKCGDVKKKLNAKLFQGVAKYFMGKLDEALKLYFETLNEAEKTKYETLIPQVLTDIGIAYEHQYKLKEALDIHNKTLAIFVAQKDEKGMSQAYSNIGSVYYRMKDFKEALAFYLKSHEIVEKLGDKRPLAGSYNNIASVYSDMKESNKALFYYFKSLTLKKELNNKDGAAITLMNIGSVYCEKKEYGNAIKYSNMAVDLCKDVGSLDLLKDTYYNLMTCYDSTHNYQKAFEYMRLYSDLKDSIYNKESGDAMAEMDVKFKTAEKDKELLLKDVKIKEQQNKQKQQRITVLSLGSGLILTVVALFFILKGYKDKQRSHELIAYQKELVEAKQKEIIDSIQYAKRIQNALLTSEWYINRSLNKLKKE